MENSHQVSGIYDSIRDWFIAKPETVLTGAKLIEIYPPAPFSRKIKRPPTRYPNELEGGFVGVIPKGHVCGLNGAVITPDYHLLWDTSLEFVHQRGCHSIFQKETLPPVSIVEDEAADLTHVVGRNYYHWMYEVLPRIHLVKQSGMNPGRYIVKSEQEPIPFQIETLNWLGISDDQLIKSHTEFHLVADKLVVPSQPSFATKWAYDFIRKTFVLDETNIPNKKRIYIKRRWARKIINEAELSRVLAQFGFETVELETLSVAEQVQLFSSSQVIIAAHGAGLTNLTFCKPGTKVIEIFAPTYVTSLYWVISSFGNLRHYSFIGDFGGKDPEHYNPDWPGMDNIIVNLAKFIAFLKTLRITM